MQIRPAEASDLSDILRMSHAFYPTTHYDDFCPMDAETVLELASNLIKYHVLLVAEEEGRVIGMVGLVVAPFMFNKNLISANEVVWFVQPGARAAHVGASLLKAIDEPCKAKGAQRIQMVHMPNSPPQAAALYLREGYTHSETLYTKDI